MENEHNQQRTISCGLPRIDHDSMILYDRCISLYFFKAKKEAEEVGEGDKSRPPEENFDNKVEFGLLLEVPADHFAVQCFNGGINRYKTGRWIKMYASGH